MEIKKSKESFTTPLYLDSGRILEPYEQAYETYGELNED
ncbi:MAG: homoserine O-acetyltransferase, partial [Campylobacterales bacterium]